jgi:hypothetical protein
MDTKGKKDMIEIRVDNIRQDGILQAIRAMRNPMDSWEKSDSYPVLDTCVVGEGDKRLMKLLMASGTEHRTFMRQIQVWCDITAPLYWWKEMDRYTVGKSQVSCSTMHKLGSRLLTVHDFACVDIPLDILEFTLININKLILDWQATGDTKTWRAVIQLLPSGYLQTRSVCQSLECVFKQINERKNHKLREWQYYCTKMHECTLLKELMTL